MRMQVMANPFHKKGGRQWGYKPREGQSVTEQSAMHVPRSQTPAGVWERGWVHHFCGTFIPRFFTKNAHSSAYSSICFVVGLPAPWPARVSIRISTGAEPAWLA